MVYTGEWNIRCGGQEIDSISTRERMLVRQEGVKLSVKPGGR